MTDDATRYSYRRRELVEPDWRRFPGWRHVTAAQWRDPQWQRAHCVKNEAQLRAVLGHLVDEVFFKDLAQDRARTATMAMLLPPHVVNTMVPDAEPDTDRLYLDPVRRYMLPVGSDRHPQWPSHPYAQRDSLHESDMWVREGLVHRYPTKVLAEIVSTCPQYCGHCTRMDLVGPSTPAVRKQRFTVEPADRLDSIIEYLRATPTVRDVVISGGDVANVPWPRLEAFVDRVLCVDSIRDIRLASKALVGLPQHWLADEVRAGMARLAAAAARRGVGLALHTHANTAAQVTPLVAEATRGLFEAGLRNVRNQGVLMAGVNATGSALLDLCFALMDGAGITPYYFYTCDMVPFSEHWRTPLWQAQQLQDEIMGYLPGFATPRIVCDVPFAGKRWVHQARGYDRQRGIAWWSKNFRSPFDTDAADDTGSSGAVDSAGADGRRYETYDPLHTLPEAGRRYWLEEVEPHGAARPVTEGRL